ncbi:MAG: ankyrin repeat domain-containing protein [Alphaproteobacteria bacterium]|nr:ankyrin repeat domain-containing protein [Alphaproteobacteria bacterium]
MEKEFSELMEAVKSNNLNEVCKIIENHPDKSKIRDLLLYGKNKARLSKDQLEQVRRELYQNSYVTELVNLSDKRGIFPLFIATQFGYKEIVEYLVNHGADINKEDSSGRTPLHMALTKSYKYLIDHKADVNKSDSSGKTPLSIAKQKGFNEIIEMLKATGAK